MLRIIIIGIIGYLLYKFIVKFLLPLAKLVSMTHRSINEVKQKMHQTSTPTKGKAAHNPPPKIEGEYIDYEEIK